MANTDKQDTLHDYHLLIAHPEDESVLMQSDNHLPRIHYEGDVTMDIYKLCDFVQKHLALEFDVVLVRRACAVNTNVPGEGERPLLLIFEAILFLGSESKPEVKDMRWVEKRCVADARVEPVMSEVVEYVQKYGEQSLKVSKTGVRPYVQLGWFQECSSWITNCLNEMGHKTVSIVQVRHADASCVLKVIAEDGLIFYLKAPPKVGFSEELKISASIADILDETVFVKLVKVDFEKHWMLMSDYGPTLTPEPYTSKRDIKLLTSFLSEWGLVQLRSTDKIQKLVDAGCEKRDAEWYMKQVETMTEDRTWMDGQKRNCKELLDGSCSEEEYKEKCMNTVKQLLDKISTHKIPLTILHDDLSPMNIVQGDSENSYKVLDFAYTCVSFPFFDALYMAEKCRASPDDLESYLELWTAFEPLPELRELLRLVEKLSKVMLMIIFYRLFATCEEAEKLKFGKAFNAPFSCWIKQE